MTSDSRTNLTAASSHSILYDTSGDDDAATENEPIGCSDERIALSGLADADLPKVNHEENGDENLMNDHDTSSESTDDETITLLIQTCCDPTGHQPAQFQSVRSALPSYSICPKIPTSLSTKSAAYVRSREASTSCAFSKLETSHHQTATRSRYLAPVLPRAGKIRMHTCFETMLRPCPTSPSIRTYSVPR
jgi:hypothetical protein